MTEEQNGLMEAGLQSSKHTVIENTSTSANAEIAVIQLYDPPSCLRCSHLLSLTDECMDEYENVLSEPLLSHVGCHYTNGNILCPASSLRISKYTDIDKAVQVYLDVLRSEDPSRLASYMDYVASKDKRTARLIMDRINEITNKQNNDPKDQPTTVEPTEETNS